MNAILMNLYASSGKAAWLSIAIPAIVAILVFILTQWVLGRRARTELLTKKLEELFFLVNEAVIENGNRRNTGLELIKQNANQGTERKDVLHLSRNLSLDQKINMYVQLYFPLLRKTHSEVSAINQDMVKVFHKLSDGNEAKPVELVRAFLKTYVALIALRDEIIDNRSILVCETFRRLMYRKQDTNPVHKSTITGEQIDDF